ncbi:MAG: hypothetical protein RBT25_06085 [Lentisphaeria bacterium]|nr:hypothetical protein [Lentisphaeria bacterium]
MPALRPRYSRSIRPMRPMRPIDMSDSSDASDFRLKLAPIGNAAGLPPHPLSKHK